MKYIALVLLAILIANCSCEGNLGNELTQEADAIHNTLMGLLDTEEPRVIYEKWHSLYKPDYLLSSEVSEKRFEAFVANMQKVKEHNAKKLSYELGLNQFADLTTEEFVAIYAKKQPHSPEMINFLQDHAITEFEESEPVEERLKGTTNIDWRGALAAARNQGTCGSCWTFAATGATEGNYAIYLNGGKPIEYLSVQQLLDCDTARNNGCDGGTALEVMKYLTRKLMTTEAKYPYQGRKGAYCKDTQIPGSVRVTGQDLCSNYLAAPYKCSTAKVVEILSRGPSQVGIDAGGIQLYQRGVFYAHNCRNDNHAVVMVGYNDTDMSSGPYYTIRNSWGNGWGESGNIRLDASSPNNACIVANESVRPVLK